MLSTARQKAKATLGLPEHKKARIIQYLLDGQHLSVVEQAPGLELPRHDRVLLAAEACRQSNKDGGKKRSLREIGKLAGVAESTLRGHVNGIVSRVGAGPPGTVHPAFKKLVAEAVKELQDNNIFLPLSSISKLFQYLSQGTASSVYFERSTPSDTFIRKFLKDEGLALRKPRSQERTREENSNSVVCATWFRMVEKVIKASLPRNPDGSPRLECLWNMDETGLFKTDETTVVARIGSKDLHPPRGKRPDVRFIHSLC